MALKKDNYWVDKKGDLVHPDLITADKKIKDELVDELIKRANIISSDLKHFKENSFEDIASYMGLLRDEYKIEQKDTKGNITLENFSSTQKVQIAVANNIRFDEKLTLAKEKIDEFLIEETKNSSENIKTLVLKAFEVSKKGEVNAKKILALKAYDIRNQSWSEAMKIIDDAIEIVSTKNYIRFYERRSCEDEWHQLPLDLASA